MDREDLSSLKDYRDTKKEKKEKTKALAKYSVFNHLRFLLNEKIKEEFEYIKLVENVKENWPYPILSNNWSFKI